MKNKIDELKRFAPNFIFSTISITHPLPRGGCEIQGTGPSGGRTRDL